MRLVRIGRKGIPALYIAMERRLSEVATRPEEVCRGR